MDEFGTHAAVPGDSQTTTAQGALWPRCSAPPLARARLGLHLLHAVLLLHVLELLLQVAVPAGWPSVEGPAAARQHSLETVTDPLEPARVFLGGVVSTRYPASWSPLGGGSRGSPATQRDFRCWTSR